MERSTCSELASICVASCLIVFVGAEFFLARVGRQSEECEERIFWWALLEGLAGVLFILAFSLSVWCRSMGALPHFYLGILLRHINVQTMVGLQVNWYMGSTCQPGVYQSVFAVTSCLWIFQLMAFHIVQHVAVVPLLTHGLPFSYPPPPYPKERLSVF